MLGPILEAGDVAVNKSDKNLCLYRAHMLYAANREINSIRGI